MKVISIGSDRSLFTPGSPARVRAAAYAKRFSELHVVVFSLRSHNLQPIHEDDLHVYSTNSFSRLAYLSDAARIVRRIPAEVITVQDPFESGLAGLLGGQGRPLHVQLHTDPFAAGFRRSSLNRARLFIMRLVLARAARVRVVSERLKKEIGKRYPHIPVSVLPIFVDIEKLRSVQHRPHPRFSPALLWMGRFEKEKDPELALRAFAHVAKTNLKAGLTMLGAGSLGESLKSLAQKLGVDGRVEFPGWQEPSNFLAEADALLVTSRYEGYGRQIVEALAAGVPVLSTDVGVAREAGASTVAKISFEKALEEWIGSGSRRGELKDYPYKNFEEYADAYCADLRSIGQGGAK